MMGVFVKDVCKRREKSVWINEKVVRYRLFVTRNVFYQKFDIINEPY